MYFLQTIQNEHFIRSITVYDYLENLVFFKQNNELTDYLDQYVDIVCHAPFLAPHNPLDYCRQRTVTRLPGLSETVI